jgi:hypothetical protein
VENGAIGPRDPALPLFVGAHVSMAGGPASALLRASKAGANGVALFVKGHRAWKSKDLEPDAIEMFHKMMKIQEEGGGCRTERVTQAVQLTRQAWATRQSPSSFMATTSSISATQTSELVDRNS